MITTEPKGFHLKNFFCFVLIVILLNACSSNDSKTKYLENYSEFINKIVNQSKDNISIDWESKEDSLKLFIDKQGNYRFTDSELDELKDLETAFNSLRGEESKEMKVNFYFENSLSMNGYLDGKNFKQVMHIIHGNLPENHTTSFFVNTKEFEVGDILNKINRKKIDTGDINNSDHTFIFSNAINNALNNNLGIVVTDGIYSVKDGDVDIVSIDIENAFKSSIKENNIETVVLKLTSDFNGIYYSETCQPGKKAIKIEQERPYYLLIFGSTDNVNTALQEFVEIQYLPGFLEQSRFFISQDLDFDYTILTQGEEKHGDFRGVQRGANIIHEIEDAKKYERSGFSGTPTRESYLQFGIAVDFTNTPLSNSYLENIDNYSFENQLGYNITDVKNIFNMDKSSKTYKDIKSLNEKTKSNFSHILTVKASSNLYGKLDIKLDNNLPAWIKNTGAIDDCDIVGDTAHTFAFDQLMEGISKAYQKISDKNEYLTFTINIKV